MDRRVRTLASPARTAGAVLVAAALLAGCAAGGLQTADGAAARDPGTAGEAPAGPAGPPAQDGGGTGVAEVAQPGEPAVTDAGTVVVVGDVAVVVGDVVAATSDVTRLVGTYDGVVDGQSTQTAGTAGPADDSATLVVRVPPARVDAFVADASALGRLLSADLTRTDVATEIADVDVRVQNARASVARVRALLADADALSDVVMLEGEMSRRQADLESLEARQRVLADQTALATLTVRLSGDAGEPLAATSTGFLAGLRQGWDAFAAAAVGALTVLGVLTPFLVLGLLVTGLVLLAVRRSRRRPDEDPVPS